MNSKQVIAVTSGRGGVGKTNVAVNLALGLADLGRRVVLLDGDLAMPNVHILLGLTTNSSLVDIVTGKFPIDNVLSSARRGLRVVSGSQGGAYISQLSSVQHADIVYSFSEVANSLDFLIIDTASGIGNSVLSFIHASHEVLIVVCDEPTSINDACALIRLLSTRYGVFKFNVLVNMTRTQSEGAEVFNKMVSITDGFLSVVLRYLGSIPFDFSVRKATQMHQAVYEAFPDSKCAFAYKLITEKIDRWPSYSVSNAHIKFFSDHVPEIEC